MRRLDFLWGFLACRGISISKSATLIGLSQPAASYWVKKDDLLFGTIEKIVDSIGCRLDVSLLYESDSGNEKVCAKEEPVKISRLLDFIWNAQKKYKITQSDWAKRAGISSTAIRGWYESDNMLWSQICLFASIYGLSIHIDISSKEKPKGNQGDVRISYRDIHVLPYDTAGKANKHGHADNLSQMWKKSKKTQDVSPNEDNTVLIKEERKAAARRLLAMNILSAEQIAEATGLTTKEVVKLKK